MVTLPPAVPRRIHILLAEDNLSDVVLMKKAFEISERKVEIVRTKDGQETLDYLKGAAPFKHVRRPDLILLDLNMPKKNGLEVLAEIKSDPELMNITVVILTNSNLDTDMLKAYESHANFYIIKPNDLDKLFVAVRHVEDIWLKSIGDERGVENDGIQ